MAESTEWTQVTEDGGITKKILVEGEGEYPSDNMDCIVHYVGTLQDGTQFDSSRDRDEPFEFTLGAKSVIEGWEKGVASMKVGEKAIVRCTGPYAYGEKGSPPTIPPNATLDFEIELIKFKPKRKPKWEMDLAEKVESATKLKEEGNAAIKAGNWEGASDKYTDALDYLEYLPAEENTAEVKSVQVGCHNNLAMAFGKQDLWDKVIENTTKALEIDPDNVKALFRRSTARVTIGALPEAKNDLVKAIKLDPKNKDLRAKYEDCKKKLDEYNSKQKNTFGSMFKKMNMYEDKESNITVPQFSNNPHVFMDIKFGERTEKVEFELYADKCPKTVENFRALCTGEKGVGKAGVPLHFKGTQFHRIIKEFMMQGGDFTAGNGTGGESIYGEKFEDEYLTGKHDIPGLLSMANAGPNTNGSQFFITYKETPWLDGKHVVFGRVTSGFDFLKEIEGVDVDDNSKPAIEVSIIDCGEYKTETEENEDDEGEDEGEEGEEN